MLSPSPTQPKPAPPSPAVQPEAAAAAVESKPVHTTSIRRRAGEAPAAKVIKLIFRPFIKLFYYLITGIRTHKLLTLAAISLLAISISATMYFSTGQLPFGIGSNPYNFKVNGDSGVGPQIQNWLYAVRDGDATHLSYLEKDMSSPTDPTQIISSYSPTKTHLTWTSQTLIGTRQESDTTVDTFVQIGTSANGPGGVTSGIIIWHFITVSINGQEILLSANVISSRPTLS